MLAGRGFGKTRAGAEWVRSVAESDPKARIALVGATLGEARAVMVEGASGILAVAPWWNRPVFAPALRKLVWRNGAVATLRSEEHTSELQSLMRISYAVFCLNKKKKINKRYNT